MRLRRRRDHGDQRLIGKWRSEAGDPVTLGEVGQVSMEFGLDGSLRYTMHEGAKDSIMLLTYRVDGDELLTNQPSHPKEERTRFWFAPDGKLVLEYEGAQTRYLRDAI